MIFIDNWASLSSTTASNLTEVLGGLICRRNILIPKNHSSSQQCAKIGRGFQAYRLRKGHFRCKRNLTDDLKRGGQKTFIQIHSQRYKNEFIIIKTHTNCKNDCTPSHSLAVSGPSLVKWRHDTHTKLAHTHDNCRRIMPQAITGSVLTTIHCMVTSVEHSSWTQVSTKETAPQEQD